MKTEIPLHISDPELHANRQQHLKPHDDSAGVILSALFAVIFFPAIVALIFFIFGAGSN